MPQKEAKASIAMIVQRLPLELDPSVTVVQGSGILGTAVNGIRMFVRRRLKCEVERELPRIAGCREAFNLRLEGSNVGSQLLPTMNRGFNEDNVEYGEMSPAVRRILPVLRSGISVLLFTTSSRPDAPDRSMLQLERPFRSDEECWNEKKTNSSEICFSLFFIFIILY